MRKFCAPASHIDCSRKATRKIISRRLCTENTYVLYRALNVCQKYNIVVLEKQETTRYTMYVVLVQILHKQKPHIQQKNTLVKFTYKSKIQ